MKITQSFIQGELISLEVKVSKSTNPDQVGIKGQVVDETRNTFVLQSANHKISVPKSETVFQFTISDGTVVEVDGNVLIGRPADRVKKRQRRRW